MLDSLRKSADSWVIKALMAVLVISFAFWGVSGFHSERVQNVATVGDQDISLAEFEQNYQTQIRLLSAQFRTNITNTQARSLGLPQQVLHEIVGNTAVAMHAGKLGLGIDEQFIRDQIQSDASFADSKGQFDRDAYRKTLQEFGMSESYFIKMRREQLIRSQVLDAITSGAYVPQTLLDVANRYLNDQRVIKYFVIPAASAGTVAAPDDATLNAFFETKKSNYSAPQYRKIGVLFLTPDGVKDQISITEEEIKASYETHKKKYGTPELRTIQQLIFKDKAQAEAARAKLKEDTDFVKFGEEFGMKEGDVNLGAFAEDKMVDKKLAAAAFKLKKGEISAIIEGFSPIVVRVTEIKPGSQKAYDEVKAEVRNEIAKLRATELLHKLYDQVEDSRAGGANLAEIGQKSNIKYEEFTVDANGIGMDGKPVEMLSKMPEVMKLAFGSDVGVENNPLTVTGGSAFVDVKEVIPERQKPLAEVQEAVKQAWIDDESHKRLDKVAQEILKRAVAGEAIEKLSETVQGKVTTTAALKRAETPDDLPKAMIPQAFSLQLNGFGSATTADRKSIVVFQVAEIKPAGALDEKQTAALRTAITRGLGADFSAQYVNGLKTAYGVQFNNKAISELVGQQQ